MFTVYIVVLIEKSTKMLTKRYFNVPNILKFVM